MLLIIQEDIPQGQELVLLHRSSEHRLHSRDKLHHTERLCQIIIRADIESLHLVDLGALCRHHDHRKFLRLRAAAELRYDLQSVLIRQHDVQEDKIRLLLFQLFIKIMSALKALYLISAVFQCEHLNFQNIFIIFHCIDQSHVLLLLS